MSNTYKCVEIIKYIKLVGHMGEIQEDVSTVEERELLERGQLIYMVKFKRIFPKFRRISFRSRRKK
jgi:hypothetical protein